LHGIFGITGGDASPALEMQERILDLMPEPVNFLVVLALIFAIFLAE
jgi:hypothetical protein